MTTLRLGTYSLFLTVILWGTLLGGIAYAHLVYFPVYLSALPDSAVVVNGPYGLNEGIFWAIIHPALILSLVVSQLYFIPELGAFRNSPTLTLTPADWYARGQRWQHLSWIRGATMYIGIVPLLIALTKTSGVQKEFA